MISPTYWAKRIGVYGGLVPFFKCVCLYFVAGGGAPSVTTAAIKCAPVICLILLILAHYGTSKTPQGVYARRIAVGLCLSAAGDALLVWARLAGALALFAAAHAATARALGLRADGARAALPLAALAVALPAALRPPPALALAVQVYAAVLATVAWRAFVRGGRARLGALMFLVSDTLLGYGLFVEQIPCLQALVMPTYYLAQLGFALSVFEPPPPPPAQAD